MDQLGIQGIRYGIDETAIDALLEDRQYCTDVIVARGQIQTAGKDASIRYFFDTNNDSRPELKED